MSRSLQFAPWFVLLLWSIQDCQGMPRRWLDWTPWSPCNALCGGGQQSRLRVCSGGTQGVCVGNTKEVKPCNTQRCVGEWAKWTVWSLCSVTCNSGQQTRRRVCPSIHPCEGGTSTDTRTCNLRSCDPTWSKWGPWTVCTLPCDGGVQRRFRACLGPGLCLPITDNKEEHACNTQECAATWRIWGPWSVCDVTCGSGERQRTRTCPTQRCQGSSQETEPCDRVVCPVNNAKWGQWTAWTVCSATCEKGQRKRTRVCIGIGACPNATDGKIEVEKCNPGVECPFGLPEMIDQMTEFFTKALRNPLAIIHELFGGPQGFQTALQENPLVKLLFGQALSRSAVNETPKTFRIPRYIADYAIRRKEVLHKIVSKELLDKLDALNAGQRLHVLNLAMSKAYVIMNKEWAEMGVTNTVG